MAVEIRHTPIGGRIKDFLEIVDYIYRDDSEIRSLPRHGNKRAAFPPNNPFWQHAEGVILTAYRNGFCVGRCTAQIDREHLAHHRDDVGSFGFFDTIDDPEVAKTLIAEASRWLKERGMRKIRGPLTLSLNDECGCLVEGFDSPPMLMMPHHKPYQGGLIEQAGLTKLKDLYAWRYIVGDVPPRARKAYDEVLAMPEVTARPAEMKNFDAEVRTILDVFNDGWSENWGFVPYTDAELANLAKELKLIIDPRLTLIVSINGEPAGGPSPWHFQTSTKSLRDFGGKVGPLNLAKLLWASQSPKDEDRTSCHLGDP